MREVAIILFLMLALAGCMPAHERAQIISEDIDAQYWGEWDTVIKMASQSIKLDPKYAWPYVQRAIAHKELGHDEKAIEDFSTAIKLQPTTDPAYIDRALIYIKLKRFREAEADLAMALKLAPADMTAILAMAEAQSAMNNLDKACSYLQRAVGLGFSDIKIIEEKKNFENLLYSNCYETLIHKK